MFERLKEQFAYIVVDAPPVLPIADSHILAGLTDRILFVVRARETPRELSSTHWKTSKQRMCSEPYSTMSITKGAGTHTRTSTTRNWPKEEGRHRAETTMMKVWLYSIASFFSLAALLAARHFGGGTHLQFMGESLGLVIVLLSCQICFI